MLAVLLPLGVDPPTPDMRQALERDEPLRVFWDRTPLDLFFAYNELHDACVPRLRRVAFGDERIPILGPEELAIFKVLFAREKDWRDLREMLLAHGFDASYAIRWLERIVAPGDERLARFRSLVAERSAD